MGIPVDRPMITTHDHLYPNVFPYLQDAWRCIRKAFEGR
jgi:hypothetical protein